MEEESQRMALESVARSMKSSNQNLELALSEYLREYMDILYHTGREEPDGHWWTRSMQDPQRLVQLIGLDMTRETFPASEVKEAMEEAIPCLVEEAAKTGRMA